MQDKDFLMWIFDRMVNIYDVSPDYDYMERFSEIIDKMED